MNEARLQLYHRPGDPRAQAPLVLEPTRRNPMMGRPAPQPTFDIGALRDLNQARTRAKEQARDLESHHHHQRLQTALLLCTVMLLYQSAADQRPAIRQAVRLQLERDARHTLSGQQSRQVKATGADKHSKRQLSSLTMAKGKTQLAKEASDTKVMEKEGSPHQRHCILLNQ